MKNILMCKPTFFDVDYIINPWMDGQIKNVNSELASTQWNILYKELSHHANVQLIEPINKLPDMVFTANAGLVHKNKFIVSNFKNVERKGEEEFFKNYFNNLSYDIQYVKNHYEGEGDHLVDNIDRHWLGTGFRTSTKVASELEKIIDAEVNVLELIDPRWYHLDTCFCPLPNGEIYWYPNAFSKQSQALIYNSFTTHVFAHQDDALKFSCNSVCVGNNIFMPANDYGSVSLERFGYSIYNFDLSEFLKAGGAAKCLTLIF